MPDGGFELPRPSGPYGIGTEIRSLVDPSRDEPGTPDDSTDKRKIAARLFYPTDSCPSGPPAPLMVRAEGETFVLLDARSEEPWESLAVIHARAGMPLAEGSGRFPVVIFSHGLVAFRDLYVSYLEDLASWGFVVVAISQLATWDADDPASLLKARLDLDKLGMFGHSYGGATSAEACFADDRFKACANLDGTFFSPVRTTGGRAITQPFMIQLTPSHGAFDESVKDFCAQLQVGYSVTIAGATHDTFSDFPSLLAHFAGADEAAKSFGDGDYARILAVSRAYLLAFFNEHLAGVTQPLLDGPSPDFPEATFEKKP